MGSKARPSGANEIELRPTAARFKAIAEMWRQTGTVSDIQMQRICSAGGKAILATTGGHIGCVVFSCGFKSCHPDLNSKQLVEFRFDELFLFLR